MADLSAASDLARLVRDRVFGWTEEQPEPRLWIWTRTEEDADEVVAVDGRDRVFPCAPWQEDQHHGPTLMGRSNGVTVRVDLPHLLDRHDMRTAIAALAAIGALPKPAGIEPCAEATRTRLSDDGRYRITQTGECVLPNGHNGRHQHADGREWDWYGDGFDVATNSTGALDLTMEKQ